MKRILSALGLGSILSANDEMMLNGGVPSDAGSTYRVFIGHEAIYKALPGLQIGEIAYLRVDAVWRKQRGFEPYDFQGQRFRKIVRLSGEECWIENRDNIEGSMIVPYSLWFESCFFDRCAPLVCNLYKMLEHDDEYRLEAAKLVIVDTLDDQSAALWELQQGCYDERKLKRHDDKFYHKMMGTKPQVVQWATDEIPF